MGDKTDGIIDELRKSLLQNYKKDLKEPMIGNDFVPHSIDLLYYHLQKIGLKRGGSCIDFPKWLKNKKATINPENNDDNCFQYALTVALNYQNIEKILKKYRKLNLLLISIIGRKQILHHTQKNTQKTIRQFLLISYLYQTILKK